jgi:hypothetical protein
MSVEEADEGLVLDRDRRVPPRTARVVAPLRFRHSARFSPVDGVVKDHHPGAEASLRKRVRRVGVLRRD